MMQRRKVDILCIKDTRWKGSKASSGAGLKLFYYGVDRKEFVRNALEVKRMSDRVMSLKIDSVAEQHWMVVCRMTLVVRQMKKTKTEQRTKRWKLKKEECCMTFRKELRMF